MTPEQYQKEILRTWPKRQHQDAAICNATLGLVGEIGEYLASQDADELGDVYYYAYMLLHLMGMSYDEDDSSSICKKPQMKAAEVAELVKKLIFHSDGYSMETINLMCDIEDTLGEVIRYLDWSALAYGGTEAVMHQNIEKLKKRYPDGWPSK